MSSGFDVIIVGSGFGGAVAACRLAEKGMSVLVLERGRRWTPEEYPRDLDDDWSYDVDAPHKRNGWADIRVFPDMAVVQGAGVGGGSLIYANVSVEARPETFTEGWPPEITYQELQPYYARVGLMLDLQELPDNQLTERFKLIREAAQELGYSDRFQKLPLAVTFDSDFSYEEEDPFNPEHSRKFVNEHGRKQGTCVHLGNCDVGCDVRAKNTLDLNYLARAEDLGAEIRPLHVVRRIEPSGSGYRVDFHRIHSGRLVGGSETGERIVLAAGSLGSTELLLRCRDQYKTLRAVSPRLGLDWSSNGDFLTPAFHDRDVNPTHGPTITAAIDFLDGTVDGERFFIEDGGFPDLLNNYLEEKAQSGISWKYRSVGRELRRIRKLREGRSLLSGVMPWFAQGVDAADGTLKLRRVWYAPWKRRLSLEWDIEESKGVIDAIVKMHRRLAASTGGEPWVPPTWTVLKNLVTPHPLGGCNMGVDSGSGVVDHKGQVFGHDRLYVLDGAIVPEAIGLNPSRTIAALAERCTELI